jgi:sporulation protein YlmC with PRC-barrel domain
VPFEAGSIIASPAPRPGIWHGLQASSYTEEGLALIAASRPKADNSPTGRKRAGLARGQRQMPRAPTHRHFRRLSMNTTLTSTHDVISSDRVEGTNVYNASGDKLGSVDNLMIDKRSGQVRYAVLEFGGFLGMGTDRYPLPWNMLKYDTDKEGYVVPLDKATLEAAPKYDESDVPAYTPEYGKQVNGYYGIN